MPYSPKWQTKTVETCLLFILDRLEYTESLGNYIPIEVFAKLHILIDEIRENGADSVKVLVESISSLMAHHRIQSLPWTDTLQPRIDAVMSALKSIELNGD